MSPIIQVKHLVKTFRVNQSHNGFMAGLRNLAAPRFKTVKAVNEVSFNLEEGELVGYLGPNGAGKSTTLKMLTGLLVPTSGEVIVDGFVPWRDRTRYVARIGAVFGQRTTLYWDLPVMDTFELLQPMYQIPQERFKRNLAEFTELLELEPFLHTPVRSLSLGQRMRADLCAALLHEPPLLFLDEPTIGLDVVAKERIRQFIKYIHQKRGATIILTTHDLSDIEKLCERVIILDQGQVLYDGSLTALIAQFETERTLVVTLAEEVADVSLPNLPPPTRQGLQAIFSFDSRSVAASNLIQQVMARYPVADLEVRRPEIETTVRRIYEERLLHHGR